MTWLNFEINTNTKSSQSESMTIVQKDFCINTTFSLLDFLRKKKKTTQIEVYVEFFFLFHSWLDSASDINCRPFKFVEQKKTFPPIHSILQRISNGSQYVHIWHSSFENLFWCATLGIHFIFYSVYIFTFAIGIWINIFFLYTKTHTFTPTSTRTHIIYPIFFVSSSKCSFVFRLMNIFNILR